MSLFVTERRWYNTCVSKKEKATQLKNVSLLSNQATLVWLGWEIQSRWLSVAFLLIGWRWCHLIQTLVRMLYSTDNDYMILQMFVFKVTFCLPLQTLYFTFKTSFTSIEFGDWERKTNMTITMQKLITVKPCIHSTV